MSAHLRTQEVKWMDPKSIKFSQDSINFFFQRGAPMTKGGADMAAGLPRGDESLQSLLEKLGSGAVKVTDIPRIRVTKHKGSWYSLDNRRLWVFRQLGQEIPVEVAENPTNVFLSKLNAAKGEGAGKAVTIIKDPEKKVQTLEFICKQELMNQILRWSVPNIMSEGPLQEMAPLPIQHTDVKSYMGVLSLWLLEETRAQLQQTLSRITDEACTAVTVDPTSLRPLNDNTCLKKLSFMVNQEALAQLKRSRKLPTSKVYNPAMSDIILLTSTIAPQQLLDLSGPPGRCHAALAVVQGGQSNFRGSEKSYEAIIHTKNHSAVYKALTKRESRVVWYAVKLGSIVTCQRIWDALRQPQATPMAEYCAAYAPPQIVGPAVSHPQNEGEESKLQTYCREVRQLNDSQARAVKSFVLGLLKKENHCCSLGLIQGPPGTGQEPPPYKTMKGYLLQVVMGPKSTGHTLSTGKTSTLTAMLSATSCSSIRILVCAPTNTAVNEAAQRFLLQREEDAENLQTTLHFCGDVALPAGSSDESHDEDHGSGCARLRLGDIVMLGSEDRLAIDGSVLKKIFLPLRVKRLLAALHPDTGWEALSRRFTMHLTAAASRTTRDPFGRYPELQNMGLAVIMHGETLCDDLPSPDLSTRRADAIIAVAESVRKLLKLLATDQRIDATSPRSAPQLHGEEDVSNGDERRETTTHSDDAPQLSPQPWREDDAPQFSPNPYQDSESEPEPEPELEPAPAPAAARNHCWSPEFLKEKKHLEALTTSRHDETFLPIFPPAAAASPKWLEAQCMENANLMFSTVSAAGLRNMKLGLPFSCVIVDEAAQLVEAESSIVTQMKGVKHLLLVGDQKQLPATVMSQLAQMNGYGRSLFERLQELGHPWQLLDVQYRMHPAISAFPNKQFYDHKLKNGQNVLDEGYGGAPFQRELFGPYAFIDVTKAVEDQAGSSKQNPVEAEIVLHLIDRVYKSVCEEFQDFGSCDKPISVGVISPYGAQVGFINDRIGKDNRECFSESGEKFVKVEVKSIDGFQGKETDIIIFSAVRANQPGKIGFVDSERRMNVALTRGRFAVWILGSGSTLGAQSRIWGELINDAKRTGCFIVASEDEGMNNVIKAFRRPGDGPDLLGALSPRARPGEGASLPSSGTERLAGKRPRVTGWNQRPPGPQFFANSPHGYGGHMMQYPPPQYWHPRTVDWHAHSFRGRGGGPYPGRQGWGPPLPPPDVVNRSAATFAPGPFQALDYDVQVTFASGLNVHGQGEPSSSGQLSDELPEPGNADTWQPDRLLFEAVPVRHPHYHPENPPKDHFNG